MMSNNTLTLMLSSTIRIADPAVAEIRDRIAKYQQLFSPGNDEPYRLAGYEDSISVNQENCLPMITTLNLTRAG